MKTKLKVNDSVLIISGSDRGRRGKILFIDKKGGRLIVEGVNKRNKFIKPNQENPKGGMITREFPIKISNVMYFCDKCKKGVKLQTIVKENDKSRTCKKCKKSIDK